jgi:hypothetical protein
MNKALATLVSLALLWSSTSYAEVTQPTYANIGGTSYHYDGHGRRWGFNESNPGTGLTWADSEAPVIGKVDWSVGWYQNSLGRDSVYVGLHKLPAEIGSAKVGVTAILASGYDWPILPIVAPTACWSHVCILATPPIGKQLVGMVSAQFRYRIK